MLCNHNLGIEIWLLYELMWCVLKDCFSVVPCNYSKDKEILFHCELIESATEMIPYSYILNYILDM